MAEKKLQIQKKHMIILAVALIIVIGIAFFVFGSGKNNATGNVIQNNGDLRIAEIFLPGMFCAGCAQSSQGAFENMKGVVSADVDIETKKGVVVYDSSIISKEQLVADGIIQAYNGKIISDKEYNGE